MLKAIGNDLQPVGAVLEAVVHADHLARQFAWLPHWAEADPAGGGQGGANDEAAALDAHDQVRLQSIADLAQLPHHLLPGGDLAHQRCDVAEQDAGLGEIRDVAHQRAQLDGAHRWEVSVRHRRSTDGRHSWQYRSHGRCFPAPRHPTGHRALAPSLPAWHRTARSDAALR